MLGPSRVVPKYLKFNTSYTSLVLKRSLLRSEVSLPIQGKNSRRARLPFRRLATMAAKDTPRNWWREGVVYQVWPSSYKDSTGSGLGDIRGVINTLPHLTKLGIDIIWMSPMYESPQKDFGYDISDYTKVWEPFGSNDDMFELINKCHDAGIKIILDLVMNHTSDEHAWFKESKSSQDNAKADWYIWKDGKVDPKTGKLGPPNNWRSIFEGSIWEWCEDRKQYYPA